MHYLQKTIDQARSKGLDDAAIKNLLTKSGWDEDLADAALQGIYVPAPPAQSSTTDASANDKRKDTERAPHLSALEAAVHHVLLWFFTISLSITIAVVTGTLFGEETSISAVSSFIATTIITLIPYGYFYSRYLRRLRKEPDATTGRVWSIITIVLHSLGAMAALITLVAVAINSPDNALSIFVAAGMIAIVNVLVVTVYSHATFVTAEVSRRKLFLRIFPVIILVLLATFITASISKVGPLRADEQTRRDLVMAAEKVRDYAKANDQLPAGSEGLGLPAGIEYRKRDKSSYELCGNFKTAGTGTDRSYGYSPDDSYVSEYNFHNQNAGRDCFDIESSVMRNLSNGASESAPAKL